MRKNALMKSKITRESLARAVRMFLVNGGAIQQLAPELVIRPHWAGLRWAEFERIASFGTEIDGAH